MRIAVAGGTGTIGSHIVAVAREQRHDPIALTRHSGVDLITGAGLDAALADVEVAIDATNITSLSADASVEFFRTAARNLMTASARAGVRHTVVLSIVGVDRMPYDYYAGKVAQEEVVQRSSAPWTIQRATQFHEFSAQIYQRARLGPLHIAPRARIQPASAREVAEHLVRIAVGEPLGRAPDFAGPREEELSQMVRAYGRRLGRGPVIALPLPGKQMKGMRIGLALPGPDAVRSSQTFAQWLDTMG